MTAARTICFGFLAVIGVGTVLLLLPIATTRGDWSDPVTALFMSTSAVCVTGLAVVDVGQYYSFFGQACLALLAQVGGLGYMTATTFLLLLLGRRFGLRDKLFLQQSLEMPGLKGVLQLVKSIIAATLILELSGAFLLAIGFAPQVGWQRAPWFGLFHSISAFNNAGFGLLSDNLMGYVDSPLVSLTIATLIILGGIGYQAIMEVFFWCRDRAWRSRRSPSQFDRFAFSLNFKIATTTTIVLLIAGTLIFLLTEYHNPATLGPLSPTGKWLAAWFQSVTPRTAGFNTIDQGKLTSASLFVTIALMFIGASPGGTGGGIKTTTFRTIYAVTRAVLQGKHEVVTFQRRVPTSLVLKAIAVFFGSLAIVVLSTILLALSDPDLEFITLFFEAVSAFATVGLSMGITASLTMTGKLVVIGTMYIGRVGVLLLMSAIVGDPKPSRLRYPEEDLLLG